MVVQAISDRADRRVAVLMQGLNGIFEGGGNIQLTDDGRNVFLLLEPARALQGD
jgi:hypothetical protein